MKDYLFVHKVTRDKHKVRAASIEDAWYGLITMFGVAYSADCNWKGELEVISDGN